MIRVIDLETTGFDAADHRVIEIGWRDIVAAGRDLAGEPYGWQVGGGGAHLVDPGRPIPPESSAIHHIIDDDVKGRSNWETAAFRLIGSEADFPLMALCAHNAKFERQWCTDYLTGGLPWICTYKCALRLWPDAPSHSNQALRYWRNPAGLDRAEASVAHRAGPDAYVTAYLLRDMLNEGAALEKLIQWSSEPALQVRCHIGKWRGTPWREVDLGFLFWVEQRDFDEDVLFTVRHEIKRREEAERQIDEVAADG